MTTPILDVITDISLSMATASLASQPPFWGWLARLIYGMIKATAPTWFGETGDEDSSYAYAHAVFVTSVDYLTSTYYIYTYYVHQYYYHDKHSTIGATE